MTGGMGCGIGEAEGARHARLAVMESTENRLHGLMTPAEADACGGTRSGEQRLASSRRGQPEGASFMRERDAATTGTETRRAAGRLEQLLEQAGAVLDRLGPDFTSHGAGLAALRERLAEERFHLAVLGQFKRGKSTLLNALLGEPLLPMAVIPLTAIPTFLRAGPERLVRVFYADGRPPEELAGRSAEEVAAFLARFVTEEANPRNRLGVSHVEVFHPAPLLRQGVVLIDTPGVGSTHRHNTEVTLNFLPQCDAALFVVSADPPVSEVEVEFLQEVRARVARLFFLMNKVDHLSREERETALRFLRQVLRERLGVEDECPVFCVSAREGLAARQSGDDARWRRSGLDEVERYLIGFLASEKSRALREAAAVKARDLLGGALMQLHLTLRSLQMPLEELEARRHTFEERLAEAERERLTAGDLLRGERNRLAEYLEQQAEELRQKARRHLAGIVEEELARAGVPDPRAVQQALEEAVPALFARELGALGRAFEERVRRALEPYQRRAEELVETVRRTAAEIFAIPYHPWEAPDRLKVRHRPYWVTSRPPASLNEVQSDLLERLLPASVRRERVRRRLLDLVETLVLHNVENLRWATLQNLDQTFRRFEAALAERLQEAADGARGAIQAALSSRAERAEAVREEVARLEAAAGELQEIRALLGEP